MYTYIMKNIIMTILAVTIFSACSKIDGVNPSQNKALKSVAGKTEKEKSGYMQQVLDNWLKNEWEPVVAGVEAPTGDTKVEIIPNKDGSAKLIESKTGAVLKELTVEQVEKQKEVQSKYKQEDRAFTLQEYVDKMSVYNANHITDEENSHVKKIGTMPVIGKTK